MNGRALVTTGRPMTVLDTGNGPVLCLGVILASDPPAGCGGVPLDGWDWGAYDGQIEERSGTRWTECVVTGWIGGGRMLLTDAVPEAEFVDPDVSLPSVEPDRFGTPCPEPAGGWVVDATKTCEEDLERAFAVVQDLDDYGGAWVDERGESADAGFDDASLTIMNVRVTRDPVVAENRIRQVWGGGLCITPARHTERELRAIQREMDAVAGLLESGVTDQRVEVDVVYDDGSLQQQMDESHGPGLVVVVRSVLQPVWA